MLILDATVGGAASNSYCLRSEADYYNDGHLYSSAWHALITTRKEIALVMATRILDEEVEWYGSKTSSGQALRWPRVGVIDPDGSNNTYDPYYGTTIASNIIPQWLKNATAELARCLVIEDRTADADMLEFSSMTIGPLSLVKDASSASDVLPDSVKAMVARYGSVNSASGFTIAKLVRS